MSLTNLILPYLFSYEEKSNSFLVPITIQEIRSDFAPPL